MPFLPHIWWKIKSYLIDYSKLSANLASWCFTQSLRPILSNLREDWEGSDKRQLMVFQETIPFKLSPEDRLISTLPLQRVNSSVCEFTGAMSVALLHYGVQNGTQPMTVIHFKRSPSGEIWSKVEVWDAIETSTELGRRHDEDDTFCVNRKSVQWKLLPDEPETEETEDNQEAEDTEAAADAEAEEGFEEEEDVEEAEDAEQSGWQEIDLHTMQESLRGWDFVIIDPLRTFCTYSVVCQRVRRTPELDDI